MNKRVTFRVGADIGGTFTDLVLLDADGRCVTRKVSSTPDNYSRAIVEGVLELMAAHGVEADSMSELVHASTIATNAILEFKGAKTALITTRGFRDVLEMRRLRIPVLYDLQYRKPPPLVPRRLRLEVDERLGARGVVLKSLDEASVETAAAVLREEGVEAVAVALIHSYADSRHEKRVAELIRKALPQDVYVTCSTDILPEIREYERTSTAVVNAYVGPIVKRYIAALERDVRAIGVTGSLQIMTSNGGVMTVESATRRPAYITESGPAAGVIACARMARALGLDNVISFDMGGTTAKAAMIEAGEPAKTTEYEVGSGINLSSKLVKGGGYPIKLPFIDVSEIGAGGGSIVTADAESGLRVGPRSAGASPGPVCYGTGGTEPTFTDAMVALGYLNPVAIAGGRVKLDAERARLVLRERVAKPLGLSLEEAAHGIYTVAAATMTRAVKAVTTYRGRDPRDFTLVAFGGNGPIAAAAVASSLSMKKVLVPPAPGVFSAVGLLLADVEHEFSNTVLLPAQTLGDERLTSLFADLESSARTTMQAEGHPSERLQLMRLAEMRYAGQAYELAIPARDGDSVADILSRFHAEHHRTYGHRSDGDPVDLVSIRIHAQVAPLDESMSYKRVAAAARSTAAPQAGATRRAYFGKTAGFIDTPVIDRAGLTGDWLDGPVIVEEYDSTCIVPPGARARLDDLANIEIEVNRESLP
ncbi:MAG: hydantoinase/oxoprolinase family protein [Gammaproteobacteria bacterium]